MNRPLLSIVIPVYNVEKYIIDCLASIPASCADKIEIILVDDCSKDDSLKVIDTFFEDKPVFNKTIIRLAENKGAGNARNTGIKAASGKYFLALDSDDYLRRGSLEAILDRLQNVDSDVIIGNFSTLKNGKETRDGYVYDEARFNSLPLDKALDHIADNFSVHIAKHLFKRSFIVENELFIPDFYSHQDDAWIPFVVSAAKSFMYFDIIFYTYRIREGSITTSFSPKKDFCKLDIAKSLYALAERTEHKKLKKLFYHKANMLYRRALRELHKHTSQDREKLYAQADNLAYIMKKPDKIGNNIKYFIIKTLGMKKYVAFNNAIKFNK